MARDDDHDKTRRRGSARDEQAAQLAMVRGLRRGVRGASGKTKSAPRSTAPAGAPGAPKGGPSGRVGKHQGKTTRTFHINVGSVKVGAGAAGSVDYLAREGHWSERDDLELVHGDVDLMKEAIREIDRTARARRGPTAETVLKTLVFELPRDATPEQRAVILREVVERENAKGHVAVGALHYPTEGDPQPHIHVAITARPIRRRDDGTIEVIRARRNVAYAVKAEVRKLRFETADLINRVADPAVRFYGGRDVQMDEPGIVGRDPRHRIPQSLWHKQGWRDIPEEERTKYAEKHKLDREKKSADKIKKEAEKTARREARWEKQGAVSKEKVQRPFKPANDTQKRMVDAAAKKAGMTMPKGWRGCDGGDLMAVMRQINAGDIDSARKTLADAMARADLLKPVVEPLLAGPVRAAARREIEIAVDGAIEAEKWASGVRNAESTLRGRYEWQEALDEALAASQHAEEAQAFTRAVDAAGAEIADGAAWDRAVGDTTRDLEDRLAWQQSIDAAIADGAAWQLSARIAQAAEAAGADIIARQAWTDGLEQLAGLDATTIPTLTTRLHQEHNRRHDNVARRTEGTDRIPQGKDRDGSVSTTTSGNDPRDLGEYRQATEDGRPESGAAVTRSDGRLADPDQPRPGKTRGRPAGDKRDAIPPDFKRNEPVGRAVSFETRRDASGVHQIYAGTKHVALLDKEEGVYYLVPIYCGARGGGPLRLLEDATIDIQADITDEIYARYYHMKKKRPDARISLLETPPEKPVEAPAPKVAPVPAPPPPAQEATMAKPAPKPRPPTENELRNADFEKIITDEPNIRQAWSDIDLRLAQDIDQMKHGELADALINGSVNRYDLAHAAGYLSKENLARINARHHEKYEIDPPKNPSREVIERQEQEKKSAADRIRAAFEKLAAVPSAKEIYEAGKRLMGALKEMMEVNKPQAQNSTDKRHPDNKHPDEITPEDFKQLVREERERQMKDPAVYLHRDRAEVVVARRLAEKRRALEERNSGGQQQPPIIIVVQQQQGEDLERLIGRLTDPSRLHALTNHLKTIGEEVRYPASRPMDLIPPASMTKMAATIEQMIAQELGRHKPAQQAASTPSPSAPSAPSAASKVLEWPLDHIYENWKQRQENIRQKIANADPRQLEEWQKGTKAAISAQKEKGAPARPTYEKAIAAGLKIVETEMTQRGLLAPDQSAEGRLKTEQERRKQQAAADAKRGGGRGG